MPVLARLHSEYEGQGFQVLAINTESKYYSLGEWAEFMKTFAPARLADEMAVQDVDSQAARLYELTALGTMVLVDREGRVAVRSDGPMGYGSLRSKIEDALRRSDVEQPAKPIAQVGTEDQHALVLAPNNPDVAFFGHPSGILKSSDGGKTWQSVPGLDQDAMNLAVSRQRPQRLYVAGVDVLMRSEDGGKSWRGIENDLPRLDLPWFAINPNDDSQLYAFSAGSGFFRSGDGGTTWIPWEFSIPGGASVTAMAVLGGDPVRVLAGDEDGSFFLSVSDGATWEQVGGVGSAPIALALNSDAASIYAGTSGSSVYRSRDEGRTWTRLPLVASVVAMAAGGSNPERVLVVNDQGEVFRSDDGGQTW